MVVLGNRSGAGHAHEDRGSFILEYAGQTFAMDPGTCDYSSSYSMMLQAVPAP
ncbi:MAG: heparinase II/III family protein [Clostridia bacterium]